MESPQPSTPSNAPVTLWLTDRSRLETGWSKCVRERYLTYHSGPLGYGISLKAHAVPLITGTAVHNATGALDTILFQKDRLPRPDEIRFTATTAVLTYGETVTERGFRGMLAGPETDQLIAEQSCLIEGFIWVYAIRFLPWLHEHYRVLSVEEERIQVLSCTCGAGPLEADEHIRRECQGVALMSRNDLIAQHRQAGHLAYFEKKTKGSDSGMWAEEWETKPQLALGTLDAKARFGAEVTELYIVGLMKGPRLREDRDDPKSPKYQASPLCYGYCRPGNPPLANDDWLPSYQWSEPDGTVKRASRAHRRRSVSELTESDWPTYHAFREAGGASPMEFWVNYLPTSVTDKILNLLGPLNRQDEQLKSLTRAIVAEEERWRDRLWKFYEADGDPQLLDELFPQSWDCRRYGKESQCPFVPICFKYPGSEDPIGSGIYVPRVPHHDPELEQAKARGLDPAQGQQEEGE